MTREDFDTDRGKVTAVKFGRQKINLRPVWASKEAWFTADHEAAGSDDLCFLTSAAPEAMADHLSACGGPITSAPAAGRSPQRLRRADHLSACGVPIIEGPTDKRGAMGTIISVHCRDPDGSLIEISTYKTR